MARPQDHQLAAGNLQQSRELVDCRESRPDLGLGRWQLAAHQFRLAPEQRHQNRFVS